MGLPAKPPAYNGYQPVTGTLELEDTDSHEHRDTDLERNHAESKDGDGSGDRDEDECCTTTRMCLPYLYRLSMAAIGAGTLFGVTFLLTRHR
ncbi:hypothetical protein G7Y79_00008g024240 [Physcia stellaris]|nr:hypothetical protein G7Y79_00008g024240 [Physcia stellaris]